MEEFAIVLLVFFSYYLCYLGHSWDNFNKIPGLICILSLLCYETFSYFFPGFVNIILSILISLWAVWYNVIKRYGLFWKRSK